MKKSIWIIFILGAILVSASTRTYGISKNTTVILTASGGGTKSYHDPDGWWQTIDYTVDVSLTVTPTNPTRVDDVFESTRADIKGTIRFIAHAEDHFFGATTIEDYDITKSYDLAQNQTYTDFLASDRSVWWIGAPLPSGSSFPQIYGMKYDGEPDDGELGEGVTGVLTNLVQLSSFWYFDDNYPVYASAVSTNRPRLILVAHGWKGSASDWPTDIRNAIAAQLTTRFQPQEIPVDTLMWNENDTELAHANTLPTGWEVVAIDWSQRANTLFPQGAQRFGGIIGGGFGALVQQFNYESIHLIGHSAGSWLVDAIADTVKRLDSTTDRVTDIHITFLDTYAQGSTYCLLGDHADWVEHYVANGTFGTDWTLPWAYNLDLNSIIPSATGDHSWPWLWYRETTHNPLAPVYGGTSVGPYGWGFLQTTEYSDQHPSFSIYRRGARIDLQSGQEIDWRPTIQQQELDLPIDPRLLTISDPSKVTNISPDGFTLTTGSPTWVSMPITVPPGFDLIRFDYQFLSSSHGTLALSVDGTDAFETLEGFSPGEQSSGWIMLADDPTKTNFVIRFLVDTAGGPMSSVHVSNIQVGQMIATQAPPRLTIVRAGAQLKLRWPRCFDHMSLESTPALGGPWIPVTTQPQLEGDWLVTTLNPVLGSQFFRLAQ